MWDKKRAAKTALKLPKGIHPDTPMSIMHGDNTGVYQAMNQLAWFNRRLGYKMLKAEALLGI